MTKAKRATFGLGLVLLAAGVLQPRAVASIGGTDLFMASVGSGPGVAPSVWYTTVWVFNPNDTEVTAQFTFLRRDADNSSPATATRVVKAGEVLQIDDAVNALFSVQGFGAIRAQAEKDIQVVARIYSKASGEEERDSVGQFFAAVPAGLALRLNDTADLLGLTKVPGGDFRYNVGFVETTGNRFVVQLQVWTEGGTAWLNTTVVLQPYQVVQKSIADLIPGLGDAANFRLRLVGLQDSGGAIAFGSRVANGSQDPTTFEMALPSSILAASSP